VFAAKMADVTDADKLVTEASLKDEKVTRREQDGHKADTLSPSTDFSAWGRTHEKISNPHALLEPLPWPPPFPDWLQAGETDA
jgi:hypothetical protein